MAAHRSWPTYTVTAGTHLVSEDAFTGYVGTIGGDCDSSGNVTLVQGDKKSCIITNDDLPSLSGHLTGRGSVQ